MAQRRRSITFANAHRLSIAAALLIPPMVAFAPEHCQLAACLIGSALLGLVGVAYRVAFQAERRTGYQRAKQRAATDLAQEGLRVLRRPETFQQQPGSESE